MRQTKDHQQDLDKMDGYEDNLFIRNTSSIAAFLKAVERCCLGELLEKPSILLANAQGRAVGLWPKETGDDENNYDDEEEQGMGVSLQLSFTDAPVALAYSTVPPANPWFERFQFNFEAKRALTLFLNRREEHRKFLQEKTSTMAIIESPSGKKSAKKSKKKIEALHHSVHPPPEKDLTAFQHQLLEYMAVHQRCSAVRKRVMDSHLYPLLLNFKQSFLQGHGTSPGVAAQSKGGNQQHREGGPRMPMLHIWQPGKRRAPTLFLGSMLQPMMTGSWCVVPS